MSSNKQEIEKTGAGSDPQALLAARKKTFQAARRTLFAVACFGLFYNLDKPAMWQDEAETALYGRSIRLHGYPNVHLGDNLITAQPTLQKYESNERGAWTWNTWIPCYLTAASYVLFGESTWAARLPFALFGLLAWVLASLMFRQFSAEDESPHAELLALALLTFNIPWLLLMRQCRYYSLVSAGSLAAVLSYGLLLKRSRWGPFALIASLSFLLHSFFIFGALTLLVLGTDAALRTDDRVFQKRFDWCAIFFIVISIPMTIFFKIWIRPGNHLYSFGESLAFLRSFLLGIHQSMIAGPVLAVYLLRRSFKFAVPPAFAGLKNLFWPATVLTVYAVLVFAISSEGFWSDVSTAVLWGLMLWWAFSSPVSKEGLGPRRLGLIFACISLVLFSFTASEPWGRYLAALIPFFCYAMAQWIDEIGQQNAAFAAAVCVLLISSNFFYVVPITLANAARPVVAAETVSGMIRRRMRDTPIRSDAFLFAAELLRGPKGYVEDIANYVNHHSRPMDRGFSDADNLSYMFYTPLHMIGPEELQSQTPEWIFPSPWLQLNDRINGRIAELVRKYPYETVELDAPNMLWQNNPDVFYHSYHPRTAPRIIYHLKTKENI